MKYSNILHKFLEMQTLCAINYRVPHKKKYPDSSVTAVIKHLTCFLLHINYACMY